MRRPLNGPAHFTGRCTLRALCIFTLLAAPAFAAGDAKKVVAFHVFATKSEKASMPKELEAFKDQLANTGMNSFKISRQDSLTLAVSTPNSVAVPQNLGTATLTLEKDARITLEITNPKKESLGKLVSPVPFIHKNEKIKNAAGETYILIVKGV